MLSFIYTNDYKKKWNASIVSILAFQYGGNNRARTCDPLLVRQMLSQLSYAPESTSHIIS